MNFGQSTLFCVDLFVGGEILKMLYNYNILWSFYFYFVFFKEFFLILPYDCLAFFSEYVHVLSVEPLYFYFTFYYLFFTILYRTLRPFCYFIANNRCFETLFCTNFNFTISCHILCISFNPVCIAAPAFSFRCFYRA